MNAYGIGTLVVGTASGIYVCYKTYNRLTEIFIKTTGGDPEREGNSRISSRKVLAGAIGIWWGTAAAIAVAVTGILINAHRY